MSDPTEDTTSPLELIASEVRKLSREMKRINRGPLKRRVIVLLIQDRTKLPKNHIEYVLNAAESLEDTYLKDPS